MRKDVAFGHGGRFTDGVSQELIAGTRVWRQRSRGRPCKLTLKWASISLHLIDCHGLVDDHVFGGAHKTLLLRVHNIECDGQASAARQGAVRTGGIARPSIRWVVLDARRRNRKVCEAKEESLRNASGYRRNKCSWGWRVTPREWLRTSPDSGIEASPGILQLANAGPATADPPL
jgi:hypothetical protein